MAQLPLLVFPKPATISPPKGNGFPQSKPHLPSRDKQISRISPQIDAFQQEFVRYKASINGAVSGLEPEMVLVIEIVGSVDDFKQAVDVAEGLEWLGEWDIDELEADEDFYETDSKGEKLDRSLKGRLFLSFVNQQGLHELLGLWEKWKNKSSLPHGKAKWANVFAQIRTIRRWGIEETLIETGMAGRWRELLNPYDPAQEVNFQIELFYRRDRVRRSQNEAVITAFLEELGGRTLGSFIHMEQIAFHAAKAMLHAEKLALLLEVLDSSNHEIEFQLFKFPGVMYFRPTGQSLVTVEDETGEPSEFPEGKPELPPVVAILDGVPNIQHEALKGRLIVDDPNNLSAEYQPGERKHGTSMASLVVHGELVPGKADPLRHQVYFGPVMQPDPKCLNRSEHIPDEIFFEDRIERAVRRMFEGEGSAPAQARSVKVINLSIGDPERPFIHTPSPWARLLDWLSWNYRVLFCVSAGNFSGDIDVGMPHIDFSELSDEDKTQHTLKRIANQLSQRRLLSPAESLNALTIGALHTDECGEYEKRHRIDLLPTHVLFSPASRFGHGFRRSIKPEILLAGGRQLYKTPVSDSTQYYQFDRTLLAPGQKVAWDSSSEEGKLSQTVHTRGTSNATALATHNGAKIYEVLERLRREQGEEIPDNLVAILIKTLLVHGAQHSRQTHRLLDQVLKTPNNSRKFKEVVSRFMGYGIVDIERVLACTEQRGTVLGFGEIGENQVHEYRFPLPMGLCKTKHWRRMTVTLAWFSPINPNHRNLREAKLEIHPKGKWDSSPLKFARMDSDHNQVLRGTVQHEVLESSKEIAAYEEDEHILLHVICKKDATEHLDELIPYGLAVTLEVVEGVGIPIYQQIRAKIKPKVAVTL